MDDLVKRLRMACKPDCKCSIQEAADAIERLSARIAQLEGEKDDLVDALMSLHQIAGAYPEDVFVPPTAEQLGKAHEVFLSVGLTLDKFSAYAMRKVAQSVEKITTPLINRD